MGTVLLVTTDRRVIAEFETIAAATGVDIQVSAEAAGSPSADTVFIDVQSDCESVRHHNIVAVTDAPAGPAAWARAAELSAVRIAELPADREWIATYIDIPRARSGTVVTMQSAVGGAGCTTLAVALATHIARRGKSTAVVDMDPNGGMDIIAGLEGDGGPRWPDVDLVALAGADLGVWLPQAAGVAVLSSDLRRTAVVPDADVIAALAQTCDVVIVDLPSGSRALDVRPDSGMRATFRCTVLPNTVRAVAVANRLVPRHPDPAHGVVVRSVAGAGLGALEVGEVLGSPVWAALPSDPRIVEQIEQGLGPSTISLGGYTRAVMHLANRVLGDDGTAVA